MTGSALKAGDVVLIESVESCATGLPEDDQSRLRRLVGTTRAITEIDQYGFPWFCFDDDDQRTDFCLLASEVAMHVQGSLAFTITARSAEEVIAEMPVTASMLNPFGTVHAGAMIWFADVAATTLAFGSERFEAGQQGFPLAINLVAQLVGNQKDGTLRAVSTFVRKGRSVSVVRTRVTGAGDKLLIDVTTSHVYSK